MKIEIEYNGAYAICTITDTFGKNPDAKMQFAYADKMSQIFALDAFRCQGMLEQRTEDRPISTLNM